MKVFGWWRKKRSQEGKNLHRQAACALEQLEEHVTTARVLHARGRRVVALIDDAIRRSELRSQHLTSQAVETLVNAQLGRSPAEVSENRALEFLTNVSQEEDTLSAVRQNKRALTRCLNHLDAVLMGVERQTRNNRNRQDVHSLSLSLPRHMITAAMPPSDQVAVLARQFEVLDHLCGEAGQFISSSESLLNTAPSLNGSVAESRASGMLQELKRQMEWKALHPGPGIQSGA